MMARVMTMMMLLLLLSSCCWTHEDKCQDEKVLSDA